MVPFRTVDFSEFFLADTVADGSDAANIRPRKYSPASAFVLSKVANGNGAYSITFSSACDNAFGCLPSGLELKARFNNFAIGPVAVPVTAPEPPKAVFGVQFMDAPKTLAVSPKHKDGGGSMVLAVTEGSVAGKAGIQVGDVVAAYDKGSISSKDDMLAAVAKTAVGS